MGRPKGSVVLPDVKRSRTNLAILLRESFHENLIRDWFLMILSGQNPVIVEDKRFSEQGGYKVIVDPVDKMVPSPERRDQAMRALLDRRDGLPAQRVQLEAEIRSTQTHSVLGAPELAHLPPRVLGAVVSALRGALAGAPPRVIDVPQLPAAIPDPDAVQLGVQSGAAEPRELVDVVGRGQDALLTVHS